MATTVRLLYSYYNYINGELSDPRTANWFLVGSPWGAFGITGLYLYFVYSIGPSFMAKRQPYNLERIIALYDIAQIIVNSYLVVQAILLGWFWKIKFICEPIDSSNSAEAIQIASAVWIYYMIKIFDLFDTVFFVLRKKQDQISFLHVYHHAGMVLGTWAGVRYVPGGHGTFLGVVNSFVHVIMYTHYLWTSLKLGKPWWKKYITQLQLFQFCIIFVQFSWGVMTKDCGYPKWPLVIFLPQNLFMMVLFGDFYYKAYIKKKPAKVDQNGVSSKTESRHNGVELSNGKPKTH